MSGKVKIKFLESGTWMDDPSKPVFDVSAGDALEVSPRLAKIATTAKKAVFVVEEEVVEEEAVEEEAVEEEPKQEPAKQQQPNKQNRGRRR